MVHSSGCIIKSSGLQKTKQATTKKAPWPYLKPIKSKSLQRRLGNHVFKKLPRAWPVCLSWWEHHPIHQKVGGTIPGQGTHLGCEFNPQSGRYFSHQCFSLSLPVSLKSINIFFLIFKASQDSVVHSGARTLENRMEDLQNIKTRTTMWNPISGYTSKGNNYYEEIPASLMLTAALFPVAKTWKQPKCPSMDERIKKLWYWYIINILISIYILYTHIYINK